MTLPTFLIVGAQKAGTTSLYSYLRRHPDVFMPAWKEPGFFVEELTWGRGLSWYESLFAPGHAAVARGEATTSYTMYPFFGGVPARMAQILPDVRLVYVLRDPLARMRSAYVHALAAGSETRPIATALLTDSRYLLTSSYALQLEQFLEHFERSRILVITAEDLDDDREATVRAALRFVGVSEDLPSNIAERHHRSAPKRAPRRPVRFVGDTLIRAQLALGKPHVQARPRARKIDGAVLTRPITHEEITMNGDLRSRLATLLGPDLRRLREHLGGDFHCWGLVP